MNLFNKKLLLNNTTKNYLNNNKHTNNLNLFNKTTFKNYTSKKHHTLFDTNIDWLINKLFTKNLTLSRFLFLLNTGLFLYCNARPTEKGRLIASQNVSYSEDNLKRHDYINLFATQMGDRRPEDFVFNSAVLLTLGSYLEKRHGTPFMFKMLVLSFYFGMLSSMFWVGSEHAKRDRYRLIDSNLEKRNDFYEMKYMSAHAMSMNLIYFFLFKRMKVAILPVFALDMCLYGPYFSNGFVTGVGLGALL